jgi:hypothetical protein
MTREFSIQLCNELSEIFSKSVAEGTTPHGFVTSLVERYENHRNQNSIFFGPIAVTLQQKDKWHSTWLIEDLRGGWGFSPLNLEMKLVPDETPTLEIVQKELQAQARRLRHQADDFDVAANLLK